MSKTQTQQGDGEKYKDEEWLREKYVVENRTADGIAHAYGYHHTTIHRWLDVHGIETRGPESNMIPPSLDDPPHAYPWMFQSRDPGPRLEWFKEVREAVESLPPTKTTFKPKQMFDEDSPVTVESPATHGMLRFIGCWQAPDRYENGEQRPSMWINPHAKWAPKYSDVAAVCECGDVRFHPETIGEWYAGPGVAVVCECGATQQRPCYGGRRFGDGPESLNDRVWANRRRIIETAGVFVHDLHNVARRLHIDDETVNQMAKKVGFDGWGPIRNHGHRCRRLTWKRLVEEHGKTRTEVAEAFGVPLSTVSEHLDRKRDYYPDGTEDK